jgi:hypothetical protein
VNPNSVLEISSAMKSILQEPQRNLLIEKGKIQSRKFSWELTASKLWECCSRVLNNC